MSRTVPTSQQVTVPYSLDSVLDEFTVPVKNRGLSIAQNVVYRREGGFGKRTGSAPYGTTPATAGTPISASLPVLSGTRWYRSVYNGLPSLQKQLVVQTNDHLYSGNDVTGLFTPIGALATGSTPAFYAAAFDATNTGGAANSDILVVAYGSGPPQKWDGANFTALSSTITNHFAGCEFFNEHIFFWNDPNYPTTIFATDLGNPEGYTFSSGFGGYQIGRGNGDSVVRRCIAAGGYLFVFKTRGVWLLQGYDFYPGQYQFSDTPLLTGVGTTCGQSVALLRNALVWWTGQTFARLSIGDTQWTDIGFPIQNTIAKVAAGNPAVMRAVCGDFLVSSVEGHRVYNNVYLCACDVGSGAADTILMYDEQVSADRGKPAWTVLKGFTVSSFIPFGGDQGDQHVLYLGNSTGQIIGFGGDPYADVTNVAGAPVRNAIPVVIQTGRNHAGTPRQNKHLDRLFIDAETTGVTFEAQIFSDAEQSEVVLATVGSMQTGGIYGSSVYGAAVYGAAVLSEYVDTEIPIVPETIGKNFIVSVIESSNASAYEVVDLAFHAVEDAVAF